MTTSTSIQNPRYLYVETPTPANAPQLYSLSDDASMDKALAASNGKAREMTADEARDYTARTGRKPFPLKAR